MKIKLIIILFIILKINLFSKEPKQFEGLIEYKVRSEILLNKLSDFSGFMFDSLENDVSSTTIKNALDSLKNDVDNDIIKLPKKVLFYSNKNGDYRIEYYNIQLIEYFIYKSNVNKFYTSFQDSLLFETAADENRFNLNKDKTPSIQVKDTSYRFNNKSCKKVKISLENGYLIEYIFSDNEFKVNPDYYVNNNFNNFYDYVKIAQSLPINIYIFVPNFLITEQTLISYKEYDVSDSLFWIDTSKIKKMDDLLGDFELTEDDKKEMEDFVSKMTANNIYEIDSLETESEDKTELTEDKIKIIDNAIQKLNKELARDLQNGIISKQHLEKCLKLLKDFSDENSGKIESQEILEEDEELFVKLLDRLKKIIENMNED